jgi:hypothetical protein
VDINVLIFSFFLHRIMEQNQRLNFIIIDQYYFIEFENKIKKASEITLRPRTLVISINIYCFTNI